MNTKLRNIIMSLTLSSVLFVPSFADETILSTTNLVGNSTFIVEKIKSTELLKIRNTEILEVLSDYKAQLKEGKITEDEYKTITKEYFDEYKELSNKIYDKKVKNSKEKYIKSNDNIILLDKNSIEKEMDELKIYLEDGKINQSEYDKKYKECKEKIEKLSNIKLEVNKKMNNASGVKVMGEAKTVEEYVEYFENYILQYKKEYNNGKLSESEYKTKIDGINKKIEYIKSQN